MSFTLGYKLLRLLTIFALFAVG